MTTQESVGSLPRIDYDKIAQDGPLPPFEADRMRAEVKQGLEDIREFVGTEEVLNLLDHVYSLRVEDRDEYVRTVILDEEALAAQWGVVPPPGIKLQRSQFGDGRPTIFCVVRVLADGIRKVTFTFDSESAYVLR